MSLPYKSELIPRARELRKNATPQENHLWYDFLRTFPVRFQRQKTICGFIADFYCHAARLVVEVDGCQHGEPDAEAYDAGRTRILRKYGIEVLRFPNGTVERDFQGVCGRIRGAVRERMTLLPPRGEDGIGSGQITEENL
ncbi:MAG: endonuclease domain-containing protein [Ruminococcaceae bacterium]|jgi:very-short-patch-repair endonuclease|nr:endonuclease domain-containing protein [Oscillospiraceae bacterium]